MTALMGRSLGEFLLTGEAALSLRELTLKNAAGR